MAAITVRNLSEDVVSRLRRLAKRNRLSMEEQVRRILGEAVLDRSVALDRIDEALKQRKEVSFDAIEDAISEAWK